MGGWRRCFTRTGPSGKDGHRIVNFAKSAMGKSPGQTELSEINHLPKDALELFLGFFI